MSHEGIVATDVMQLATANYVKNAFTGQLGIFEMIKIVIDWPPSPVPQWM